MPSRKLKTKKHKTNRNERRNDKKNDKKQRVNQTSQPKQPEIIEMLQKLTSTPQYIKENKVTEKDKQISDNIKLKLCNYLKINYLKIPAAELSKIINTHIFRHSPALSDDTMAKIFELQSIFGAGSIVLYANTPKNFYNHRFEIPSAFYHIIPDKSCIINNNMTFIPLHILKMMNIECTSFDAKKICIQTVIIQDFPNTKDNFVYYQNEIFFNSRKFQKFLKKKKWSSKKFRRELPEFVKAFNSDQFQNLIGFLNGIYNVEYADNLCKFIHLWIPQNLVSFIEEETQKFKIQKIMDTVYRNCEINEEKYEYLLKNHYLETIKLEERGLSMMMQFPFIMKALQEIPNIIGIHRFREIFQDQLQKNQDFQMALKLNKFKTRIEGRNCSYCNKKEIRSIKVTETFKKCKRCQNCFYCSVQCQKQHWNKKHRNECKPK